MRLKKGFSLIEVLISVFLFSVISISIMRVVDQTTKSQKKVENIIKKGRILNNISYLIVKDLQMSWAAINVKNWIRYNYKQGLTAKGEADYLSSVMDQEDLVYLERYDFNKSGLVGTEDSFFFTSASQNGHGQTPIIKIGYVVEACEADGKASKCLMRKTSLVRGQELDSFHKESLKEIQILDHIKDIKISYWNSVNQEWTHTFAPFLLRGIFFPHPFPMAIKMNIEFDNAEDPIDLSIPIPLSFFSFQILNESKITAFKAEPAKNSTSEDAVKSAVPPP